MTHFEQDIEQILNSMLEKTNNEFNNFDFRHSFYLDLTYKIMTKFVRHLNQFDASFSFKQIGAVAYTARNKSKRFKDVFQLVKTEKKKFLGISRVVKIPNLTISFVFLKEGPNLFVDIVGTHEEYLKSVYVQRVLVKNAILSEADYSETEQDLENGFLAFLRGIEQANFNILDQ